MSGFKEPSFADRQKAAQQARQDILNKFRAKPGPDDPEVKQRQAEREAQAAARAKVREAREAAKAEQKAREAEAAALAAALGARRACETAKRDQFFFMPSFAIPSSFFMPSFIIPSSFFIASFFMPSSFFMASLDIESFFMPSSLPILSWAKAAGASARLSERTAAEKPSAMRVRMVMGLSSFEPVSKATDAAMFTTVPRPRLLPVVSKSFREGLFQSISGFAMKAR